MKIIEIVRTGQWHFCPPDIPKETFKIFQNAKDSFSVGKEQDILLKGNLIVVPESLQNKIIELPHEGHQGINKTKALLCSKLWFPGMTTKTEMAIRS